MRRSAALALAALALTACSGEQGARAEQLLTRAQAAQARLTSATYEARLTFSLDGRRFGVVMDGGGYLKGRRAGDQLLTMRTDGVPGMGAFTMQMIVRGRNASMSLNGRRMSVPLPAGAKREYNWSANMLDLARYVKKVKVREGRVVNGERGATIAGVVDTEALVKAAGGLDLFAQAAKVDDFAGKLGDIHAAVFVAQRTGLIRSAVISLTMEAGGENADLELTYRLSSTNRAIAGL